MFSLMKRRTIQKVQPKIDPNLHIQKERRRLEKEIGQLEKQHKKATKAYNATGNHAGSRQFRTAAFVARAAGFANSAGDLERCLDPLCHLQEQKDRVALAGVKMRQEIERIEDRIQELKTQLERLR